MLVGCVPPMHRVFVTASQGDLVVTEYCTCAQCHLKIMIDAVHWVKERVI
jgi:hypothetical protein